MSEPILLVVKRGAVKRFDTLQRRTSNLSVRVIWDRRQQSRRTRQSSVALERRKTERRQRPPYNFESADFSVAFPPKTLRS